MKKILLLLTILFVSVITTACINNFAAHELNNKAVSYMDKGDAQSAICRLKSSLELNNELYETHYNLALAYNAEGQFKEAIEELETVIKLKPDYYDAFFALAFAKESLAYQIIEKDILTSEESQDLSLEDVTEFNKNASEAVDIYNEYIVKKNPDEKETTEINQKILELNNKIKEYTQIQDTMNALFKTNLAENEEEAEQ